VLLHRLVLSPAVGLVFLGALPLPDTLKTILLLLLSMPPLVSTALVAASFGGDEELAASGVVLPTLLSLALVPLGLMLF
jgi:predicted permease